MLPKYWGLGQQLRNLGEGMQFQLTTPAQLSLTVRTSPCYPLFFQFASSALGLPPRMYRERLPANPESLHPRQEKWAKDLNR